MNTIRAAALRNKVNSLNINALRMSAMGAGFRSIVYREIAAEALRVMEHTDMGLFIEEIKPHVATVTFFGGDETSWTKSLPEDIDASLPRCLADVENVFDPEGENIPIGIYNLMAVKGLGKPFIVWRSHFELIEQMALQLGMEDAVFVHQQRPLGHGDAMRCVLPMLDDDIHYVMTNFCGDANSKSTMMSSLAVFTALQWLPENKRPWGLLPAAFIKGPEYPIVIDKNGYPVSFGHNRLKEKNPARQACGHSNVGVRLYIKGALSEAALHFQQYFAGDKVGYFVPGNKEQTLGLDNIDEYLASLKRLQLFCVASPEEITASVKQHSDIPRFIAAMRSMLGMGQ